MGLHLITMGALRAVEDTDIAKFYNLLVFVSLKVAQFFLFLLQDQSKITETFLKLFSYFLLCK